MTKKKTETSLTTKIFVPLATAAISWLGVQVYTKAETVVASPAQIKILNTRLDSFSKALADTKLQAKNDLLQLESKENRRCDSLALRDEHWVARLDQAVLKLIHETSWDH